MHYNTWHGSIIGHPQPQSPYIVIISLTYVIQHYLKCVSSVSLFLLHKKNLNRIIMSRVLKWKEEYKSALNWAFTLIDILMAARKCSIILLSILRIMMQWCRWCWCIFWNQNQFDSIISQLVVIISLLLDQNCTLHLRLLKSFK